MDGYCHPILELAKTVLELRSLRNPLHAHDHPPSDGIQEPLADEKARAEERRRLTETF